MKKDLLPYFILFIVPVLLYAPSFNYEYVLDDKIVITENDFVKEGIDGIWDIFSTESFTGYLGSQQDLVVGSRYRPLSIAMFAVEYEWFGLDPSLGHILNVLLYALTGLVLFHLLRLILPVPKDRKWYLSTPFVAALLFVLHPLHTEVVANIKSRDEILALLFALLALRLGFQSVQSQSKFLMLSAGAIFFLALLAKETAITFLAVVPLTCYCFTRASLKRIAVASLPFLISAVVYIIIRYQVIGYLLESGKEVTGLMNNPFLGANQEQKLATICYTMGTYIKLLFFPHPLTHDYYPYHIPIVNFSNLVAAGSLLLMLALAGYALFTIRRKTITAWAILYYLITLSIASNLFFPIGTFMNERFVYMPSVGFSVLLAFLLIERLPNFFKNRPKVATYLSGAILLLYISGFTYKTIDRIPAWKNEMALNRAASKVSVNSARANQYMAYSLYRSTLEMKDRDQKKAILDEATYYVDRALSIYPTYTESLTCKAGVLAGYYELDRDLDKLLNGFYKIQTTRITGFVDQYLNYLDKRADRNQMRAFYRKLGNALLQRGNKRYGNYYLGKAK